MMGCVNLDKMDEMRKEQLIDAALDEFIQKSFDKASLNNILKKAEISKGSFYYHFKNKKELYLYIFDQAVNAKMVFFDQLMKDLEVDLTNKNIFETLRELGKLGLRFAAKYPKYYLFAQKFFDEKNSELVEEVIGNVKNRDLTLIDTLIDSAINNNELRDDFSRDFIANLFKNLLINFSTFFFNDLEGLDLERLLDMYDDYLDFIENGLGKKK